MTDTKYNGWTNYATWRVALEIFDGFEPLDYLDLSREELDVSALSATLADYAHEVIFEGSEKRNIADSYAEAFLSDVNWYEIARHMLEEEAA